MPGDKLRITENERNIIKNTIKEKINNSEIYLFGSRIDDNKKGGDIDLLVVTDEKVSLETKLEILAKLEINGINRKIDLILKTPETEEQNIIKTALEEGKLL
ncbi:MAG: nucleotidyltransferase domain-containing protein [Candidatus Muiribacteriota bacterium]